MSVFQLHDTPVIGSSPGNEYVARRRLYYQSIESLDSSPELDLENVLKLMVSFPQIYPHDYVLFRTDQFLFGT